MSLKTNLNALKIFAAVYSEKSMTLAAQKLNLTQSGVSQHIKKLEEDLNVVLFERKSKEELVPTLAAEKLYPVCEQSLNHLDQAIQNLNNQNMDPQMTGIVKVGVPIEFGNTWVLPKLAQIGKEFPHLQFDIHYGFATRMNQYLLSEEIDFAFVDQFKMAPQIQSQKIYQETFSLCISKDLVRNLKINSKNELEILKKLSFVDYQKNEPVLRKWFGHHYSKKSFQLDIRAWAMDVQGLARLIENGLGAGVLPEYFIDQNKSLKESLYVFKGKKQVLVNDLSVCFVKKKAHSAHVKYVLNRLIEQITTK